MRQLDWTAPRFGMSWSNSEGFRRRFVITRTSSGFTVADKTTGDLARVASLAAARAWAGIRAGEQCVRHGGLPE